MDRARGRLAAASQQWLDSVLVTVRVVYGFMFRSKEQMAAFWENDPDTASQALGMLKAAADELEAVLVIVRGAESRLIISGAAAASDGEKARP